METKDVQRGAETRLGLAGLQPVTQSSPQTEHITNDELNINLAEEHIDDPAFEDNDNTINNSITVFSYNCRGFSDEKVQFMKTLFEGCNSHIFGIQEHFLLRENFYKIDQAFENYDKYFLPATRSNNNISKGRPSKGLAILWRKDLVFRANPTKMTSLKSDRVHGVVFHFINGLDMLYINAYFPTNRGDQDDFEIMKTLNESDYLANG